jgi:hypothetical protein
MLLRGMTVSFEGDAEVTSVIDMHSVSHVGASEHGLQQNMLLVDHWCHHLRN